MKKHSVILWKEVEGRSITGHCVSYLIDRSTYPDNTFTSDWRKFCIEAKKAINNEPDKKYFLAGDYTKTTHMVRYDRENKNYYSKNNLPEFIGWKKLKRMAEKIFGDDYKVTHEPFHNNVFITKK